MIASSVFVSINIIIIIIVVVYFGTVDALCGWVYFTLRTKQCINRRGGTSVFAKNDGILAISISVNGLLNHRRLLLFGAIHVLVAVDVLCYRKRHTTASIVWFSHRKRRIIKTFIFI